MELEFIVKFTLEETTIYNLIKDQLVEKILSKIAKGYESYASIMFLKSTSFDMYGLNKRKMPSNCIVRLTNCKNSKMMGTSQLGVDKTHSQIPRQLNLEGEKSKFNGKRWTQPYVRRFYLIR